MNELTGYPNRGWWLFLLRGIVAIAFGVAAFVWPTLTLTVLIALFGAYVFVDGAFGLAHAIRSRGWLPHWWLGALEGALGVVLGLLAFLAPGVTAFVLLMIIATWAIIGGALRIALAIWMRREIRGNGS